MIMLQGNFTLHSALASTMLTTPFNDPTIALSMVMLLYFLIMCGRLNIIVHK